MTLGSCVSTFMDRTNAHEQRERAKAALRAVAQQDGLQLPRIASSAPVLFDAFAITDARCDATVDGRHYPRLLATINTHWLGQVVGALAGGAASGRR